MLHYWWGARCSSMVRAWLEKIEPKTHTDILMRGMMISQNALATQTVICL